MPRINLIGKKRRESRSKNIIVYVAVFVYCVFVAYFFASAGVVVYRFVSLNSKLASVEQETQLISAQMLKNDEILSKYVLSKFILGKIQTLNKNKFRYKDYLDQISSFMPSDIAIRNVDFSVHGWVSVSVVAPNIRSLGAVELSLTDQTIVTRGMFSSVFIESVAKDKSGAYILKLQIEIKRNC
jgi:hypothetical protein